MLRAVGAASSDLYPVMLVLATHWASYDGYADEPVAILAADAKAMALNALVVTMEAFNELVRLFEFDVGEA